MLICKGPAQVNRGFTSSFGYLSGAEDHFDDTRSGNVDLWRSSDPAYGENGTVGALDYNTYKFTAEALDIIRTTSPRHPRIWTALGFLACFIHAKV